MNWSKKIGVQILKFAVQNSEFHRKIYLRLKSKKSSEIQFYTNPKYFMGYNWKM